MTNGPSDLTRNISRLLGGDRRLPAKWPARLIENTLIKRGDIMMPDGPFQDMAHDIRSWEGGCALSLPDRTEPHGGLDRVTALRERQGGLTSRQWMEQRTGHG